MTHSISKPSMAVGALARQLFEFESKQAIPEGSDVSVTAKVCAKLQVPISKFAGPVGYSTLLLRALALAKAEIPELNLAKVGKNGALEGFHNVEQILMASSKAAAENAGVVLVAQLLGLLFTFIGEPLTVNLLCDAWPDQSFDKADQITEEKS